MTSTSQTKYSFKASLDTLTEKKTILNTPFFAKYFNNSD